MACGKLLSIIFLRLPALNLHLVCTSIPCIYFWYWQILKTMTVNPQKPI